MRNRSTRNIVLISLISIFLLVFNIIIKKHIILYAECIMAAFMLAIVFLAIQSYGIQKDKSTRLKSNLFLKTAQILTIYFIVISLFGLYFGFSKIVFSLKPISIINNTFAPVITFSCLEIFRYIITNGNKDNKKTLIIMNILIGILELSITTRYLYFYSLETAYKTIADYLIPVALKQVAFGILCYHGGLKPSFLYRIIMVIYTYMVPIHPNFSETIVCMCNIILPILIITSSLEVIDVDKREKEYITKKSNLGNVVTAVFIICLFILITGVSPIGITAIASDSMYPTFGKGSGVVTLKLKEENLKEGDIISFNKKNKKIIHRIDKIEVVGKEKRYFTKGDANNVLDKDYVTFDDINDKILFSIPLIGYPSIIFYELIS